MKWIKDLLNPPFVWVLVNPARPHITFATFSETEASPWPNGIRLTGADAEDLAEIYGMIIDWDKFTADEQAQIKTGYFTLSLKKMKALVRR